MSTDLTIWDEEPPEESRPYPWQPTGMALPPPEHPPGPDRETMDRFRTDPKAVWDACERWRNYFYNWPTNPPEFDESFDNLTEALQLWGSLNGLGDGGILTDASILWYRPSARDSGLDTFLKAAAFIQLVRNRAGLEMP